MKKVTKTSKKQVTSTSSDSIFLSVEFENTIKRLPQDKQDHIYRAHIGTIRQLMNLHNDIAERRSMLSNSNKIAATQAMAVLEIVVDGKIERCNEALNDAFDETDKKTKKVVSKKTKKK